MYPITRHVLKDSHCLEQSAPEYSVFLGHDLIGNVINSHWPGYLCASTIQHIYLSVIIGHINSKDEASQSLPGKSLE